MVAGRTAGAAGDGGDAGDGLGDAVAIGDGDGDGVATDVVGGRDDVGAAWGAQAATETAASAQMRTRALTPASVPPPPPRRV